MLQNLYSASFWNAGHFSSALKLIALVSHAHTHIDLEIKEIEWMDQSTHSWSALPKI